MKKLWLLIAALALTACAPDQSSTPAPGSQPATSGAGDWLLPALAGYMIGNSFGRASTPAPQVINNTTVREVVRAPMPTTAPKVSPAPAPVARPAMPSAPKFAPSSSFTYKAPSYSFRTSPSFGRR